MWNVFYPKFWNSEKQISVLSRLKIEISQMVLWVIREFCEKNKIDKIWAALELQIHREYLFPIVDRIDEFEWEEILSFQKQIREEMMFLRGRIQRTLESEKELIN